MMDDRKTHWFITVVRTEKDSSGAETNYEDIRCWGYEESFDEAEEAVINNYSDLSECFYQWAIIEEHMMGYFAMPTGKYQWFHWNVDKDKFERCDRPTWSKHICSWGIG